MKVLITGANGMLGRTLQRRLTDHVVLAAAHAQLDVTSLNSVAAVMREFQPDVVVHCAAMTAVDKCESEIDTAWRINCIGSANVAIECHRHEARLIAISTDYVFSGSLDRPYHEWDSPNPLSVYGKSKLAGEEAVRAHCPDHVILRLGWLYGQGGPSFIHAMLNMARQPQKSIKVVQDQTGNPTSTAAVSDCIIELIQKPVVGVIHATCEGAASRYELAKEIFSLAKLSPTLIPCATSEFARPAPRPQNAQLEKRAIQLYGLRQMPHWKDELKAFFRTHPEG